MRFLFRIAPTSVFISLLSLFGLPAFSQQSAPSPSGTFPFVLPWDDATSGTVTDVSFLNAKPAGVNGNIVVRNGHFAEAKTGQRIRFIGASFAAKDAFPDHGDAEKVAARIAKLGINLVRLHHMDNDDWGPDTHIWDDKYADRQHISAQQLDKLDYLIAQLKKNGVYVNINLHVSRQFSAADGFPASVSQIPFSFDKRVDEFDAHMIQLQKNYAHDLLTHVNPYTHLSYAEDPCVAVVEINNENSLVGDPWATLGTDLDTLPEPFRGELVGLWNNWLAKKYGKGDTLKTAWLKGVTPSGPAINTQSQWSIEHQGDSMADTSVVIPSSAIIRLEDAIHTFHITKTDGTDWHIQAHQTGLNFQNDTTYTVSFQAKADAPRTIGVTAGLDQADWHQIGLSANVALTTDWKPFTLTFDAHDVVPDHGRIAFVLGGQTGIVEIKDLQIKPGAEGAGLQSGQSLAAKNIDIPVSATKPQHNDWLMFLADTEKSYADNMRGYLKDTLKVQANIICSQISWGGLSGLGREANMDFADNHAYWQHPSFPHKAWDSQDWTIENTSQVADMAKGGGGALRDLAEYRVAGKPYTISEYNEPAPNDFQAEAVPLIATFAAYQDWDVFYMFDYGDYGTGVDNDKILGYFATGSNPAKTAFLPAAAMIFRASELPPALASVVVSSLQDTFSTYLTAPAAWNAYQPNVIPSVFGTTASNRGSKIALEPKTLGQASRTPELDSQSGRDAAVPAVFPSSLLVTSLNGAALYTAVSAKSQSVVGYVGGQTVNIGHADVLLSEKPPLNPDTTTLTFPQFGNNFAAVTITAMDDKSLIQSKRILLTLVGKVENQGMVWNATRTSVGDQWGHGPTMAEGIPATVTLKTDSGRHVYALDGTGKHDHEVKSSFANGQLTFTVGPQDKTVWYEIAP